MLNDNYLIPITLKVVNTAAIADRPRFITYQSIRDLDHGDLIGLDGIIHLRCRFLFVCQLEDQQGYFI